MAVNYDKLFISDKGDKVIYSPSFGFIRITCLPKKISVQYYNRPLDTNDYDYGYWYTDRTKEVKWDDIYVVSSETVTKNGRSVAEYQYDKFSFNNELKSGEVLAVKIGEKYHKISNNILSIRLYPRSSDTLAEKFFGSFTSAWSIKKGLDSVEWREDNDNQIVEVSNIKQLIPGTKVFVDVGDGGEGEIVRIEELSVVSKAAIFKVKLYTGKSVTVDYYKQVADSQAPKIKLIVPNTYEQEHETNLFNESIEELQLNPFVRTMTNGFNIYWQPVEGAASYIVELYTWNENSVAEKLYKLESRTVERNQFYCAFSLLTQGTYYVRVIAEDRAGAKIAVNRAISFSIR